MALAAPPPSRWGIGAVQDVETHDIERRPFGGLQAHSLGPLGSLEFYGTPSRCHCGTGPSLPSTGPRDPPTACSQCLFIHYYKMKRRGSGSKVNWGQYGTMVGADGYEHEYEVERDDPSLGRN